MDSNIKEFEYLHEKFFNVANEYPLKTALKFYKDNDEERSISYEDLKKVTLEIGKHLFADNSNFSNNNIYVVYCETGISAIACLLAILQNGVFFYLSPEVTENELVHILKKIPSKFIVVQKTYYRKLPKSLNPLICKDIKILNEDFLLVRLDFKDSNNERISILSESRLAYIICTSGSTGYPKIVFVPHICIAPNIKDFQAIFNITSQDTILNSSPLYFDPSIIDIFLGINTGATVIILSSDVVKKSKLLDRIIRINLVSFMQITPSLFKTINRHLLMEVTQKNILRAIALGGERFPSQSIWRDWFDDRSKLKVYNLYGLTELSCWATCQEVDMLSYLSVKSLENSVSSVPIGKPLSGVKIYLADKYGNKKREGKGIIMLTGERNVCHITGNDSSNNSGCAINTGDLGFTDGVSLFCIRRVDEIVKRNACKISLAEIERISNYLIGVSDCCAVYAENKILLFITSSKINILTENLLKIHLKKYLSSWKLPDKIIFVNKLPLNKNGKVDKQSLLANNLCTNDNLLKPINVPLSLEHITGIIETLWKDLLGLSPQKDDNFINLGGNSFQAIQLTENIESFISYKNPLTLQTVLNDSFEDICSLVFNNSVLQNKSFNRNDVDNKILKISSYKPKIKDVCASRTPMSCQGGHYLYQEGLFLNKLNVVWTVFLNKCIDSSPLVVKWKEKIKIYIGSHSHDFFCLDGYGKIIWKVRLPDRIEGSAYLSRDGNAVYVGCYDGKLYCFEVNEGKELWAFRTEGKIKATCAVNRESGFIIIGSYDKHLYFCDEMGSLKWKTKLSNGFISSTSVIHEDRVFTGTLDGYIICVDFYSGIIRWKIFIGKPIFSSLAICTIGIIFGCADNVIYCVSFEAKILWKYETEGPIFSSPNVLECDEFSIVAIGSHDNNLYLLDTNSGNKLAVYRATSAIYSTPFLILKNNRTLHVLVAETNGIIHSIEFEKRKEAWNQTSVYVKHLDCKIFSSPVFFDEKLYIGCRSNMLYCLSVY